MPVDDITTLNHIKLDALASTYGKEFSDTEITRQSIKEDEWLQSLRQSIGIHDPDVISKFTANDSRVYSQYTRSKEVPLRAKLNHHLIPEKEKSWEIVPTPKPEIDDSVLATIVEPLIKNDPQTGVVFPTDPEIATAIKVYTEARAAKMSETINDQLVESKYSEQQKHQIKSGIRYGTGVIKGPNTESYEETETVFQATTGVMKVIDIIKAAVTANIKPQGKFIQRKVTKYRPTGNAISLWRCFPDMATTDVEKADFWYELHSKTRHEMRGMAKRDDFFGDIIKDILVKHPKGNYRQRSWETSVDTLEENGQPRTDTKNYEVVERNGFVDGQDLLDAGILSEYDETLEYFCSFWMCNNQCIKISIWPDSTFKNVADLYHVFYYEKDETSIFGRGLPKIIRDRQLTMNAGERHMINHAAWLEAPCGEIALSLLHPDSAKTAQKFGPGTFLAANERAAQSNKKILEMYDIQDNMESFIKFNHFQKDQGDQESSLSAYLFGAPQPGADRETAKGVSVKFESLIDFIKDLAKNFDTANTSYISSCYSWNMAFNDDPDIKGDLQIKAIGSAQALIRDAIRENVSFFMQSLPEMLNPYFKLEAFAKELCKSLFDDVDKFIYTEIEVQQRTAETKAKQDKMDQMEMMLKEVKGYYDHAKAEAMLAKADKTRGELSHDILSKDLDNEKKKTEVISGNIENMRGQLEVAGTAAGSAAGGPSATEGT